MQFSLFGNACELQRVYFKSYWFNGNFQVCNTKIQALILLPFTKWFLNFRLALPISLALVTIPDTTRPCVEKCVRLLHISVPLNWCCQEFHTYMDIPGTVLFWYGPIKIRAFIWQSTQWCVQLIISTRTHLWQVSVERSAKICCFFFTSVHQYLRKVVVRRGREKKRGDKLYYLQYLGLGPNCSLQFTGSSWCWKLFAWFRCTCSERASGQPGCSLLARDNEEITAHRHSMSLIKLQGIGQ